MSTFVLLAGLLTVAGVALIAIPLLKKQPVEYSPAPWAALIATGDTIVLAWRRGEGWRATFGPTLLLSWLVLPVVLVVPVVPVVPVVAGCEGGGCVVRGSGVPCSTALATSLNVCGSGIPMAGP